MNTLAKALISTLFVCSACNCSKNPNDPKPQPEPEPNPGPTPVKSAASYWTTTADGSKRYVRTDIKLGKAATMSPYAVRLDEGKTYQTISGFGPAITGSTGWNLQKMPKESRTALLTEIFSPTEGAGVSLVRVSIGSSDFGLDEYTCCDTEGIENFAIHDLDKRDVFPILKEIYAINPDLKIIGTPWSAPRWMKRRSVTDNSDYYSWTSGSLKPSCYKDYATYFVKWIQAMEAEGFKIEAITIQNEPLNHGNAMSMYMGWEEERDFIKTALGPAFEKAGIKAKILLFDHNYNYDNVPEQKDYATKILADPEAAKYVAGSAWHNYGGSYTELDNVVEANPDKDIYFTEASIGTWNYNFASCLIEDFRTIFLETLKRSNKAVTLWNLMLDENGAPNRPKGCKTCFGAVEVSSKTYQVTDYKTHYYQIKHASQVVKPGAVRIGTEGYTVSGVDYLAFKNPDGSYGVLLLNTGNTDAEFVFVSAAHSAKVSVAAKSIVSLGWKD